MTMILTNVLSKFSGYLFVLVIAVVFTVIALIYKYEYYHFIHINSYMQHIIKLLLSDKEPS